MNLSASGEQEKDPGHGPGVGRSKRPDAVT